jgi:predicted RNA-binding Zn-ribbon protein involved in translation (DUF1610 family)
MSTKYYTNLKTNAITYVASFAKQWHENGDDIAVTTHDENGRTIKSVFIPGTKIESEAEKESRKNWEMCKHIANELEYYVNGNYHTCPDCGNTVYIPDTVGDKFKCPDCGTVNDIDDFEQLGIWDYMNDIIDIDFLVNSSKECVAAKIAVTLGGPNIYIDTEDRAVSLYWWTQSAKYYLRSDVIDAVNDWAEDYYNCI